MKQLNWGDELCGKVIAPDGDLHGWLMDHNGEWLRVIQHIKHQPTLVSNRDGIVNLDPGIHRPIYPPAGWAGKHENELWKAMIHGSYPALSWDYPIWGTEGSWQLYMNCRGEVHIKAGDTDWQSRGYHRVDVTLDEIELPDPAALILALQNALVLSKRLKEARDD